MDIILALENVSFLKPLFLLNIYRFIFSCVLTEFRNRINVYKYLNGSYNLSNRKTKTKQESNQKIKWVTKYNLCI